jgi:glycosyltransferase involved in cell wall biosynthesis
MRNFLRRPVLAIDCRMIHMSGIGVYIQNLLLRMADRMPYLDILLIGNPQILKQYLLRDNIALKECLAPVYSLREQWEIPLSAWSADLLWVPHYNIPIFTKMPLAVTVHDVMPLACAHIFGEEKSKIAQGYLTAVAKKATLLFTVSEFSKHEFLHYIHPARHDMIVSPNGVDESWFSICPQKKEQKVPYIIAVGNIKKHKCIDLLCHAYAKIHTYIPHNLIVVGKKEGFRSGTVDCKDLENLALGRIHFIGAVDTPTLQSLIANAYGMIFPSNYEGFGLPPLEAMAASVPVLAADIPTSQEVCGAVGRYFHVNDDESLQKNLVSFCNMPENAYISLKKTCTEQAKLFTWEKTADVLAAQFNEFFTKNFYHE